MTPIDRRQFLTVASAAMASGIACKGSSSSVPAVQQLAQPPTGGGTIDLAKPIATHFLTNVNVGRFGLGQDKAAPALWINVYGLAAVIVNQARNGAHIVFPQSSDHNLRVWSRDPATGMVKDYPVKTSLAISGVKGTPLTPHHAGSGRIEHPSDDLALLLDSKKLGIVGGPTTGDPGAGIGFGIAQGELFAGRPYAGADLLFRTREFKDLNEAELYIDMPASDAYALTDNFNWLAAADGTPTITIDGKPMTPQIDPDGKLYPVCITNDSTSGHHANKRVLQHSRHYGRVIGRAVEKDLRLPVFATGQAGETDWLKTWSRNSDDPICESFIFWNA